MDMKLLNAGNTKTRKGEKKGYITFGTHLAPADESGYNVCSSASEGCKESCLNTAGRGKMSHVQTARINKTIFFFENRQDYMDQLFKEIKSGIKKALKNGMIPCYRPNLTSDLPWEKIKNPNTGTTLFDEFPDLIVYDYTKHYNRMIDHINGKLPKNYHLTFSRSEENGSLTKAVLAFGGNVAVVFADALPTKWMCKKVVNGDDTDLRFLDGENVVVGLKAKGDAKKDTTGFVVQP